MRRISFDEWIFLLLHSSFNKLSSSSVFPFYVSEQSNNNKLTSKTPRINSCAHFTAGIHVYRDRQSLHKSLELKLLSQLLDSNCEIWSIVCTMPNAARWRAILVIRDAFSRSGSREKNQEGHTVLAIWRTRVYARRVSVHYPRPKYKYKRG